MAKPVLILFLFLFPVLFVNGMASTAMTMTRRSTPNPNNNPDSTEFVRSSCRATRYPALCFHCLSIYANAIKKNDKYLAQTALLISLSRTRSAVSFVAKLSRTRGIRVWEYRAIKDCIETMGDSVDRLDQSFRELGHSGQVVGQDFGWHMSNVQTWVSAALTDENTCLDGFSERIMDGHVKAAVRRRVLYVAQVTSNALALVNCFANKHRPAGVDLEP